MSRISSPRPTGGPRGRRALVPGLVSLALCGLALVGAGCGGTKGNRVSGAVTFKGAPVPFGKISFNPDTSKGNKGLSGYADINNGHYDTGGKGAQGTAGGAQMVHIEGFESPGGAMICLYDTKADLPQGTSTKDFDVPESAGKNLPKPPAVQP